MTTLNNSIDDLKSRNTEPEVLIELPEPKGIDENCTIILNGHHNFGVSPDKETSIQEDNEEPKISINSNDKHHSKPLSNGNHEAVSKDISSGDEDSDVGVEPESSSLLLRDQESTDQSPKCLKSKPKLPTFKSSPLKKQNNQDPHSHIQHRPLGVLQDTTQDHFENVKFFWPFSSLTCLALALSFFLMLIVCIAIGLYLALTRNCPEPKEWWQRATIYEIFPASFQDSDGDGFGDMNGIIDRLDYIQNLSIKIIRLNSIFSALDYPLEYEHVIDFANIDPHLGRIEDFKNLVREIHSREMYVILDINPTVTSDQHTWAAHWLLHRPGPYQSFYINETDDRDDEPRLEANLDYLDRNWTPPHRTFGSQLFLNFSNPLLQLQMRSILELWLSMGVDGFYMKHLDNIKTTDSDPSQILLQWRQLLDVYGINSTYKILILSRSDLSYMQDVMDPLTFMDVLQAVDLVDVSLGLTLNETMINEFDEMKEVNNFIGKLPFPPPIIWHTGTVETTRLAGRVGDGNNLAVFFLLAFLPGSFSTFYGDEIGMEDSFNSETLEVFRGGQLAPMQWSSGPQANFTSDDSSPWLPLHPSYFTRNVITKAEQLQLFKSLVKVKQSGEIQPSTTDISGTSMIQNLVGKFSRPLVAGSLSYEWYRNTCGLVVTKGVKHDLIAAANFGVNTLNLKEELNSALMTSLIDFISADLMENQFDVVVSTNSSLKGRLEFSDVYIGPGGAIIGRFIT